ncbi:MAG: hypothetical protein PVJ46_00955 [Methyloceanibacter sp.]|jgi:hypothetical protein
MSWTRLGALALLIIGSAAGAETRGREANDTGNAMSAGKTSIEETWARMAPEMGKHLPMAVDDKTTWLTVSNEGPVLVSTFRIDLPKEQIQATKDEMERAAIENTCRGTESGQELLDAGGVLRQVFYDRNDQLAVTIDVNSTSCRQR